MSLSEIKEAVVQLPPEELTALRSFVLHLATDSADGFDGTALSESALARDWNSPEEDAAWANL
jgi:hypothetical protein